MQGDFSRDTNRPKRRFTSVLMQQGRVQLDADWNEQAALHNYYIRSLARDLIGPHGGPADHLGFEIKPVPAEATATNKLFNFVIGTGRYYVDGLLAVNEGFATFLNQPDSVITQDKDRPPHNDYLAYLDVWERHVNGIEDPAIVEKALNGLDTATRSQLIWEVRLAPCNADGNPDQILIDLATVNYSMQARVRPESAQEKPCVTSPESMYRGPENQLYRIEIHYGRDQKGSPTFKWSRENGSATSAIESVGGGVITLRDGEGDADLSAGDWVEVVDDDYTRQERNAPLRQVRAYDPATRKVTVDPAPNTFGLDGTRHPYLRRWDQKKTRNLPDLIDGSIPIRGAGWIPIEAGIEVAFHVENEKLPPNYRDGDYWLIPARTATGGIEWPQSGGKAERLAPTGVEHHYAPLFTLNISETGTVTLKNDLRKRWPYMAVLP